MLKGTLISATANHHRPSKDGFRPVGHVRIKRVQGSMHMGSDLPFLDHITYPHHLLSPDQSVYTVELPWLSLNKNDHPRTTTSITGSKRILETRGRIQLDTHRCLDCSKAHLFQPQLIIIALARTPPPQTKRNGENAPGGAGYLRAVARNGSNYSFQQ